MKGKCFTSVLFAALWISAGCASYGPGGYYGGVDYEAPQPDMFLWGGDYDRGPDVQRFSRRGHESRQAVHAPSRQESHGGGDEHGDKK